MKFNHGLTFTDKLQYACLGLAPLLCMIAAVFLFFTAASLFLAGHSSGEAK